jgi:predicted enzyme related to lactoylglutathione lyase
LTKKHTLLGLSTISFYAQDHEAAKNWYTDLLGKEPYFSAPGYFEFRIGDCQHELGIIDARYAPDAGVNGPTGAIAYWHVEDVNECFKKLIAMGAKQYQPINDRGSGFITASVVDPFGNILGIITNPYHLEIDYKTRNH